MVKKVTIGVLASIFLLASAAFAFDFKKENVVASAEYNYLKSDLNTIEPLTIGTINLESKTEDVELNQGLVKLGYKLSDYLTPYALLGASSIEFNRSYNRLGFLLNSKYEGSANFTYGFGAEGKLADLPKGTVLSYDVRRFAFGGDEITGKKLNRDVKMEADYAELDTSLILSKELQTKKFVKSITPYIGYKYSYVSLDTKQSLGKLASIEQDVNTSVNSMLIGVNAKVTDNISVGVGGSFFGQTGVMAKATYSF